MGWTARCRGVGLRPPGAGWCRQPAVPFPCSAVLRGQEGLHCKMAFQDFLRQPLEQDAAAHRLPGEPAACMDAGVVWGPSAALFQASPRANLGACGPGNPKLALVKHGPAPMAQGRAESWQRGGSPISPGLIQHSQQAYSPPWPKALCKGGNRVPGAGSLARGCS